MLLEAVPNFSEGRDGPAIERLAAAASAGGALLLDVHSDPTHNRSVITLAATGAEPLMRGLLGAAASARNDIDLRRHNGVHPRVGAADVIPILPLLGAGMKTCVEIAHDLGLRLWRDLGIPVYFYGLASQGDTRTGLAAIRAGRVPLDLGSGMHPTAGAACVGVREPLVAYNVLLPGATVAQARDLARAVRAATGGMPGVQSLVFDLGKVIQLSMNLVDIDTTPPSAVLAEVRRLAEMAGLTAGEDEIVGLCPARAALPAAAGRILEARLAQAAARLGSEAATRRPGEEAALLGVRLAREAGAIGDMGSSPDEILAGAERAAALRRVLKAGGVLTDAAAELLAVAVPGLRGAVAADTAERHAARVAALDRWLAGG